jgi:predicted Rossmann-fold nucleotide-binding protein
MATHRKIITTMQVTLDGMAEAANGATVVAGGPGTAQEVRYAQFADRTAHYVLSRKPQEFGRDIYVVGLIGR